MHTETTLFSALKDQNWPIFKQLLESGADFAQTDDRGMGLIHHLVKLVSPEKLTELLATQAPAQQKRLLNQFDVKGQTLLHHAAEASRVDVIPWLIEQGLSVNAQNQYGYTPLHQATKSPQFEETIDVLLTHHPDLLLSNQNGDTVIQYAVGMGLIPTAMHLTRILLTQLELSQSSQFSLLAFFETFYLSFSREEKPNFKAFRRNQLQQSQKECFEACERIHTQDPVFPLLLFLLSEIFLAQEIYTNAMAYATAGYLRAQGRIQQLLDNQRRRVLIQFRQTSSPHMDALSFPAFPTSVCGLPPNQPLDLNTLLDRLRAHRAELKRDLKVLPFSQILKRNNQFFKELSQTMFSLALGLIKPPNIPPYSFLTLGSLSQDEMAPYSDLEFALLITDPKHRSLFAPIIDCMELLVVALGETPLAIPGHAELLPTGYHFDPGGNTPKFPEFLGTPEELAEHQRDRDEGTAIRRQTLRNASFLMGDSALFAQYQVALRKVLKQTAQPEVRALFQNALQEFSLSGQTQALTVKRGLYRLPSQTLNGLCLYHGLFATGGLERVKVLFAKKILSRVNALALTELLEAVLKLRFETHLHYGTEEEALYHPDRSDLAQQFGQPYVLDKSFIQQHLFKIYPILFGLESGIKAFLDNKTTYFYDTPLLPTVSSWTDYLRARIHERLLPEKALGFYQSALQVSPTDWNLQLAYQGSIQRFQDHAEAQKNRLLETGKTFTQTLAQIFQALPLPLNDYAVRYHSLPDCWKADFLSALESHPELENLQASLEQPLPPQNWSRELRGEDWAYKSVGALKFEKLEELSRRYQQALTSAEDPEKALFILALLPVLAEQITRLEKVIEEQAELGQKAVQSTLQNLLQQEKKTEIYLKVYRQTPPPFKASFRRHLAELGQHDPRFTEKLLKTLHQEPDETGIRPLWEHQKTHWKSLLETLVTSTPGKGTTYNLDSPLLGGRFVLKPEIAKQLLDEQGEFRMTDFKGVQHAVVRLTLQVQGAPRTLYLKAYPEMPGMSYLIEQLHQHLIGHGTSLSELIKLERPQKRAIPLLISEEVTGPTLHEVLKESPEQLLSLNHRKYTELVWLALLTNPEDGLPTNYIFHTPPGEAPTLVSVDHDHALFPPFAWEAKKRVLDSVAEDEEKSDEEEGDLYGNLSWQLQIKTILFCLDALHNPLDEDARKAFLRLNPHTVLTTVLQKTQAQNAYYEKLFSPEEIRGFHQAQDKNHFRLLQEKRLQCTIPIPLKEGDTILLYQKWMKLRQFLTRYPRATLLQCLLHLEPRVGLFYAKAFEDYDNPLERLLNLGRYPTNAQGQMVTRSRAAETLRLQSQEISREAYSQLQDLTPAQGLAELEQMVRDAPLLDGIRAEVQAGNFARFLRLKAPFHKTWIISGPPDNPEAVIRWPDLPKEQQAQLLQLLIGLPFERLKLGDCPPLNLNILQKILKASPELQELDLSGHPAVTEIWFIQLFPLLKSLRTAVLNNLPNLKHLRSPTSLPHLEWLIVSDNPQLETLSLKTPRLKFLQAKNNPKLKSIQTGSHLLREADLRGNVQLTRQGIEKNLASTRGLSQLQRLQFKDSGIQDPLLEDYPMLLIEPQNSEGYRETQALLRKYLGQSWREHPPTAEQKRQLGRLMQWGFRKGVRDKVIRDWEEFLRKTIQELQYWDKLVRNSAREKLFQALQEATFGEREQALYKFLHLASDKDWTVRRTVAVALGEIGNFVFLQERAFILSMLLQLLGDKDFIVRSTAAEALGKALKVLTSEERDQILSALLQLLENKDSDVRDGVVLALGEVFKVTNSEEFKRVLYALLQLVDNEEQYVRRTVVHVLDEAFKIVNPKERELVLPTLQQLAGDGEEVKALAKAFKVTLFEKLTYFWLVLLPPMGSEKETFCHDTVCTVGEAVKGATPQEQPLSVLLQLVGDEKDTVRRDAVRAFGKAIKRATPEERNQVLSVLLQLAGDKECWFRGDVARALGEAFKGATSEERTRVLSVLLQLAKHKYSDARCGSVSGLGEASKVATPEEHERLLPALLQLARDQNQEVSRIAMNALDSLGQNPFSPSTARSIMKTLSVWLKSSTPEVRRILVKSLFGWIAGENAGALLPDLVALLRSLMKDWDERVRASAKKAFSELQARFNLESTLRQIANEREAQLKNQQQFVPMSLVGRRTVLAPVNIDLSLPEPLRQPVQVFEQQLQQINLRAKAALEKLLEPFPSGFHAFIQNLIGQHEALLKAYHRDRRENKDERRLAEEEAQLLKELQLNLSSAPGIDVGSMIQLQASFFEQQKRLQHERAVQEAILAEVWHQILCQEPPENREASEVERRIARMEARQNRLIPSFAGQSGWQEEQQALKAQSQLGAFYVTLRIKLEEIFLVFRILENQWLKPGRDKKPEFAQGINLAGECIPLNLLKSIKVLGRVVQQSFTFLEEMKELAQLVEAVARQLTRRYALQIKGLSLEGAELLADCAVIRMLGGIREDRVKAPDSCIKELLFAVMQPQADRSAWQDRRIPRQNPSDKPWTQQEIFSSPMKVPESPLSEGREAVRSRQPEDPLRNFVNPLETRQKVLYQSPTGEKQLFEVGWAAGTRQNNCFFHSLLQLKEQRPVRGLSAMEERQVQIWADGLRQRLKIEQGRAIEIDQGEANPEAEAIVREMKVNVEVYVQTVRQELVFVKSLEGAVGIKAKGALVNTGGGHYVPLWPIT